ncbi:MAG: hypothetical protein LIV11_05775 [Bacillota bacterium]|nr:hypothetical protein [Bacillota bacterium]
MATRRMISREIICSDVFVEMPYVSQALYIQMIVNADDDGFVANPKQITRSIGANDESIQVLIDRGFVYTFKTGIMVIKHWLAQNKVQADRYKPTKYASEKNQLSVNAEKEYVLKEDNLVSIMDTKRIQFVSNS